MTWNGFWRLGTSLVRDGDEGRYGVAASEMMQAHSALITTYGGAVEFTNLKPPLGYWLLEMSYRVVGESPLGLRLPAALCALIAVALTMLLAQRIAGRSAALLAGLILSTSFGFLGHHGARSGEFESPLTLLLLLFFLLTPQLATSRVARLAAGLVLGLAFLLKSFAMVPFVVAAALYTWLRNGRQSWRAWPLPLAITLAIVITWALARTVAEGSSEFVRRLFLEDLLLHSTSSIDAGTTHSPLDYAAALFDRLAPWPLVVLAAACMGRSFASRRLTAGSSSLLWCYTLVPLALLTLAPTHRAHDIIPAYPMWAILGAVATLELLERARNAGVGVPITALLVLLIANCEARVVTQLMIRERMPPSQIFLSSVRAHAGADDPVLHTTFPPSYSERFFLQVINGYRLEEVSLDPADSAGRQPPSGLTLIRRADARSEPLGTADRSLLAQNDDYTLVHLASSAAPLTLE